jgi:hypothetical protein
VRPKTLLAQAHPPGHGQTIDYITSLGTKADIVDAHLEVRL